jgi:hypothetical protein
MMYRLVVVTSNHEEELDLGLTRKDFSIVMSSRRRAPSFFLGPARFAEVILSVGNGDLFSLVNVAHG